MRLGAFLANAEQSNAVGGMEGRRERMSGRRRQRRRRLAPQRSSSPALDPAPVLPSPHPPHWTLSRGPGRPESGRPSAHTAGPTWRALGGKSEDSTAVDKCGRARGAVSCLSTSARCHRRCSCTPASCFTDGKQMIHCNSSVSNGALGHMPLRRIARRRCCIRCATLPLSLPLPRRLLLALQ